MHHSLNRVVCPWFAWFRIMVYMVLYHGSNSRTMGTMGLKNGGYIWWFPWFGYWNHDTKPCKP